MWKKVFSLPQVTGDSAHRSVSVLSTVWILGVGGSAVLDILMFFTRFVFFAALELDKKKVIETAPLSFRSLLGVLGIEAALDSLIRLFSADNN